MVDLGSTNGTYLMGSRLENGVVGPGAVLTIGRTELALVSADSAESIPVLSSYGPLRGNSNAMKSLYRDLHRIEGTDESVLILGETGTGKSLVARAIHERSKRAEGPFVVLDCASLAPDLLESELYGHVQGAFTGAHSRRRGAFDAARHGTLFLDEVAELSLAHQARFLRALEEQTIRPLGSDRETSIDCRIIAATHRPLDRWIDEGLFRSDLFYRLNVLTVHTPPLRERSDDIPTLCRYLLHQLGGNTGALTAEVIGVVTSDYDWPGNVRELRNLLARVLALGYCEIVPRQVAAASEDVTLDLQNLDDALPEARRKMVESFEIQYLKRQLARAGGNLSEAARSSGMDRSHFKRLLDRHGLRGLSPS